jgi:hypothetical protein
MAKEALRDSRISLNTPGGLTGEIVIKMKGVRTKLGKISKLNSRKFRQHFIGEFIEMLYKDMEKAFKNQSSPNGGKWKKRTKEYEHMLDEWNVTGERDSYLPSVVKGKIGQLSGRLYQKIQDRNRYEPFRQKVAGSGMAKGGNPTTKIDLVPSRMLDLSTKQKRMRMYQVYFDQDRNFIPRKRRANTLANMALRKSIQANIPGLLQNVRIPKGFTK